uniref:MHC class II antigen beta chain n=1 Tax=Amblyrhynchus cristatus TaxID=51208 RepID=C6G8G2_AMBCR|nr:MHC class II antigen beta chain [Amblyrhynchus cristatus]
MGFAGILALALAAVASGAEPPEHFLIQERFECSLTAAAAGSRPEDVEVRFVHRHIYDREELARFDSARGEYEAVAALGEPDARYWNGQKEVLDRRRAEVDAFCRHNYENDEPFARKRLVQPKMSITPAEHDSSSQKTVLICDVAGFWPSGINVTWLRNGKEEDKARVMTTALIRNGDWTFQIQVMLETKAERGDVYACRVEHPSFPTPASIQWEPQSDSARSKMWTGVAGIILGLVFLAPGFILFLRNKKVALMS